LLRGFGKRDRLLDRVVYDHGVFGGKLLDKVLVHVTDSDDGVTLTKDPHTNRPIKESCTELDIQRISSHKTTSMFDMYPATS
jgi:hypothetical protein